MCEIYGFTIASSFYNLRIKKSDANANKDELENLIKNMGSFYIKDNSKSQFRSAICFAIICELPL